MFICFIIAYVFDVVAISRNSQKVSSTDLNQVVPRIISFAILLLFTIYELANIKLGIKKYFMKFWNLNDMLLIIVYATYFSMTFAASA